MAGELASPSTSLSKYYFDKLNGGFPAMGEPPLQMIYSTGVIASTACPSGVRWAVTRLLNTPAICSPRLS